MVVVYYFGYGYIVCMVSVVVEGVGVDFVVIDVEGNIFEDVWVMFVVVDVILFGLFIYMGGLSWQFKKFVDVLLKLWFEGVW